MLLKLVVSLVLVAMVAGHGRLVEPPSRASAWRYGFKTPPNYNDNELYCGGFMYQQARGGACGLCGDPVDQNPRQHEAGGVYATGTIVRNYKQGEVMPIGIDITANHKGWFEFRLCSNNDINKPITQACLDQHLLPLADGSGTRFTVTSDMRMVTINVRLPARLTCTQCVLQWKYNTGNSWGTDPVTGQSGIGFGPQEQFYGCSDISVQASSGGSGGSPVVTTSRPAPTTTNRPVTTQPQTRPPASTRVPVVTTRFPTRAPSTRAPSGGSNDNCRSHGLWAANESMDLWCKDNCSRGYCPETHCICD